jgi:hypothetical protein
MGLMKALVVYESMFGNTRRVAEAVASGLALFGEVSVVPVAEAGRAVLSTADLVVVGGPTHVHGMTRPRSRAGAVAMAHKAGSDLVLEPNAEGPGVREWLADLPRTTAWAAAFDTRMTMAPFLTGRASRRIHRRLRAHGFSMVLRPKSFLVNGDNTLMPGEEKRAQAWGEELATAVGAPRLTAA